jgi:hypothetical protein
MMASKDYYQIVGVNGLCLDIRFGVKENGTPLDITTCAAANVVQKLWALIEAPPAPSNAPIVAQAAAPAAPATPEAPKSNCQTDEYTFSAVLSQSVSVNSVSTAGASCSYSVAPITPGKVQFTSAAILKQPNNGTFDQVGGFAFKYQPKPGFRGSDEYAIKVCGHNSERAGCAIITYHITVN